MGTENWKPNVAVVKLTFCYYVDADDEDMIAQAKEMILEDVRELDYPLEDCIEVEHSTDPQAHRDSIIDYLLDCQVDRMIAKGLCPYCKESMQDEFCHNCDEDWSE